METESRLHKPAECRGSCPSYEGNIDSKPDSSNHRVMTLGLGQWADSDSGDTLPPSLSSIPGHIFLEGENQFLQVASSIINGKKGKLQDSLLDSCSKEDPFLTTTSFHSALPKALKGISGGWEID